MKPASFLTCFLLFVSSCLAQGESAQLKSIEQQLSAGQKKTTDILIDPALMQLHSITAFRELIRKFAKQEKITLTTAKEPGIKIAVKGKLTDQNGKALSNLLVYVYHTDNKGWYSDTAGHVVTQGGDSKHARLFGYVKTNNDGTFEINTIAPQGYPDSDLPQHIHLQAFANNGQALITTELLFEEDKRLTPNMRQNLLNEGAIISFNNGTQSAPVYHYNIKLN